MGKRKVSRDNVDVEQADGEIAGASAPLAKIAKTDGPPTWKNKEKVLLLSSRGITHRYRHLMLDLIQLLPHCKKDVKLDTKTDRVVINEVADMKGCSSIIFFEARKKKDLYIWLSKSPDGPSVKFLAANVHTLAELKLGGNHLKGSRPVLSFHAAFDEQPHYQLLKEMLTQAFATPKRHPKSKPFLDHVLSFSIAEGRIWLRNYQVVVTPGKKGKVTTEEMSLVEVGPRVCLQPIKIFAGSFGGPVLYENPGYVSPNKIRAAIKKQSAGKYSAKVKARGKRREHVAANPIPKDELGDVFK
ncbi:Ribosome biogenesis protein BRX1 homolog [Coccomyxa sp. Obi]|nr:Ribosome biogenesis protein BRX1 homolog [Coccomyxa sp. Obi]